MEPLGANVDILVQIATVRLDRSCRQRTFAFSCTDLGTTVGFAEHETSPVIILQVFGLKREQIACKFGAGNFSVV